MDAVSVKKKKTTIFRPKVMTASNATMECLSETGGVKNAQTLKIQR